MGRGSNLLYQNKNVFKNSSELNAFSERLQDCLKNIPAVNLNNLPLNNALHVDNDPIIFEGSKLSEASYCNKWSGNAFFLIKKPSLPQWLINSQDSKYIDISSVSSEQLRLSSGTLSKQKIIDIFDLKVKLTTSAQDSSTIKYEFGKITNHPQHIALIDIVRDSNKKEQNMASLAQMLAVEKIFGKHGEWQLTEAVHYPASLIYYLNEKPLACLSCDFPENVIY